MVGQAVGQGSWPTDIGHGYDRSWPVMTVTIAIPTLGTIQKDKLDDFVNFNDDDSDLGEMVVISSIIVT